MDKGLDGHGFVRVVGRDILEYLCRVERGAVLDGHSAGVSPSAFGACGATYLIIADQPDSWGLVILIIRDHHVVCADLQEIAFRRFSQTVARQ